MEAVMTIDGWSARRLSPALGVLVEGLDLRGSLPETTVCALRDLFDEHGLLLFREQDIDAEAQLQLCAALRPVVEAEAWISNTRAGFHPESELLWHSDFAFTQWPMLGLSLYAIDLAPGAAPTRFANNARAADALSPALREQLEQLHVVHCLDAVSGRNDLRTRLDDIAAGASSTADLPRFARPALWAHPVTGRTLLFVLEQQASHFEGWTAADSDALLDAAFDVLYADDNVYEHDWRVGDLIVWDNLTLQHGRRANPATVHRSLRRVMMNTVPTSQIIAGTGFDPVVRAARSAS